MALAGTASGGASGGPQVRVAANRHGAEGRARRRLGGVWSGGSDSRQGEWRMTRARRSPCASKRNVFLGLCLGKGCDTTSSTARPVSLVVPGLARSDSARASPGSGWAESDLLQTRAKMGRTSLQNSKPAMLQYVLASRAMLFPVLLTGRANSRVPY